MISVGALPLRIIIIAIGMIGISWGISEYSFFRRETTIGNIAKRIVAGEPFKASILLDQAELAEQIQKTRSCRPSMLRSVAIVRLRMAEISDNPSLGPAPVRTKLAVDAIRASLSCSPDDPFFWLVLFALEPSGKSDYLVESYRLGPNEGWIALKRNPVAFAAFDELSDNLQEFVVPEFFKILEMDLYDDATKILVGPAWEKRDLILSNIDQIPLRQRQNLAQHLADGGFDLVIPGATANVAH